MNKDTLARFWSKVQKTDSCWIWTASKRHKGYGAFVWATEIGKVIQGRAHRFSYELHKGAIPEGMFCLHHCDNPACVNPDHLWLGTAADNNHDMVQKGRHHPGGSICGANGKWKRGVAHHAYKVTSQVTRLVKRDRDRGMSYLNLGKKYKLATVTVYRIINGR